MVFICMHCISELHNCFWPASTISYIMAQNQKTSSIIGRLKMRSVRFGQKVPEERSRRPHISVAVLAARAWVRSNFPENDPHSSMILAVSREDSALTVWTADEIVTNIFPSALDARRAEKDLSLRVRALSHPFMLAASNLRTLEDEMNGGQSPMFEEARLAEASPHPAS